MIEICPNIVNPKNLLAAYSHDIFIAVTKKHPTVLALYTYYGSFIFND